MTDPTTNAAKIAIHSSDAFCSRDTDPNGGIMQPMPNPAHQPPRTQFRVVETLRLFVEGRKGHPLYGLAALFLLGSTPTAIIYAVVRLLA